MTTNQSEQQPTLEGLAENSFGDFYIESINKHTFKTNSVRTVYDNYYATTCQQSETLYILGGTDVGLLPKYLFEKYGDDLDGRKFIFIEFQSVMESEAFKKNTSDLPSKFFRFLEPDNDEIMKIRDLSIEYFISRKVRLLKSLAVIDRVEPLYQQLWKVLTEGYMQLQHLETFNYSKPFVKAQLRNISLNSQPIAKLRNQLKGKKAIVLGGGPSIDTCLDWIKENKEHFYIFSVGRIAARLLKEGIIPDFFVSVDPHDVSYDNSKQMLLFADQSILLNSYHVSPKLLNKWSGENVYFDNRLPWIKEKQNSHSPGPTVVHSALQQAVFLGCDEVYMAGVDMCFLKGQTHESGSAEKAYGKMAVKHLLQTETYNGDLAETDLPFYQGINGLKVLAQGFATYFGARLYNLSGNAAKVDEIEYCPPREVAVPEQEQKAAMVEQMKALIRYTAQDYKAYLLATLDEIQKERKLLQDQKKLMKKGADLAKNMIKQPKNEAKIHDIKNKLEKKLGDQSHMLFQFGYANFANLMKPVEDENNMSLEETQYFLAEYFSAMNKSLMAFIKLLDETIKTLKFRLLELSENDLSTLLPQWEERQELGRHLSWKKWHPSEYMQIKDTSEWKNAESAFKAEIELTDTQHIQNLKQRATSVSTIFAKMTKAFDEQNIAELESLRAHIQEKEQSEFNDQLLKMVEAMLCEFNQQDDQAQSIYESIDHINLKMFALKRVLHFALQARDHDKVLHSLQSLVPFSKEYLVNFADYMALLGQKQMALQVYQVYLQDKPENVLVWVKLADMAKELNQTEVFAQAISQIQHLDKNSSELKRLLDS